MIVCPLFMLILPYHSTRYGIKLNNFLTLQDQR
jgi:hypothetical protein